MKNEYKLYHGDCIEVMKTLGSVDAIITDPPYNISRKNNFKTMGRAGIDFGSGMKDSILLLGLVQLHLSLIKVAI